MLAKGVIFVAFLQFVVPSLSAECDTGGKVVACYYGSWAYYRNSVGKFTIADIDPTLCTHVIYTFAGLDQYGGISSLDQYYDITLHGYKNFTTQLKEKNPCIKTSLAIGGWNEMSRLYSVVLGTDGGRNALVDSIIRFIVVNNFDGLDFDWEYPTQRGGISQDKDNLAVFLKLLKVRFAPYGLLLTMAVPLSVELSEAAYDVEALKESVDYVHLMAYDFTPTVSNVTGLLAPLSAIEKSVNFWLNKGLPSQKLVLGMPTYARSFILVDGTANGIGAPVKDVGKQGTYTTEPGFLSYYELQGKLATGKYKTVTSDDTCYAYYLKEWLSFDSLETYQKKTQYALDKKLGGIMVWSIDTDDFRPLFGNVSYPVLRTINAALRHEETSIKYLGKFVQETYY